MADAKQSIDFSAEMDVQTAAAHLEALARSLRDGRVLIESGERSINLETGRKLSLSLEARSNSAKGKSSVEVKLEWVVEEETVAEAPPRLTIASGGAAYVAGVDSGGDGPSH